MTVTGIIAEFNSFHKGHKYLLEQASGLKIIAMSGNFVQRGEPAIVDKWTRAQMALKAGADLILELPFLVNVQAADFFAKGAVDILKRLGVELLKDDLVAVAVKNGKIGDTLAEQDILEAELMNFIKIGRAHV